MGGAAAEPAAFDVDLTSLSAAVRALVQAAAAAVAADPVEQPGAQALEDARALLAVKERLDAHLLVRLRDVGQRELHALDALPTLGTWVAAQTSSVDRPTLALVRRLDRVPAVRRELLRGRLSLTAAQRVARTLDRVRPFLDRPDGLIDGLPAEAVLEGVIGRGVPILYGEALGGIDDTDPRLVGLLREVAEILAAPEAQAARLERGLVALACRVEGLQLPACLEQLTDALLPVQLEERAQRTFERRALALARHDSGGGGRLEADLDDETLELLHTALAAQLAHDPEQPADTAAAAALRERGIDPYGEGAPAGAPRTLLQRRHDALRAILRSFLGSGIAGQRDKAVPHLLVRVSADSLDGVPGALPAVGGAGRALPTGLVRRLTCHSAITRFVMSLGGRVIEMSHTVRTLKGHERRAKLMEGGGRCQAAGCHHPPGTPLVPHHPEAYARTGRTSFRDTVMLCEASHDHLHVGGHALRLKDGRILGPDGWIPQIPAA